MIFHSANNLKRKRKKKKKKEKKKKEKKEKKKKKKEKKKKRGHKRISIKPHAIIVTWSIPFKHGQVIF
jgi:hypothetical protein